MGDDVAATVFTREDRQQHREKVRRCLDVFARMLRRKFDFETPLVGLEIELNLVDDDFEPALKNAAVLDAIADPDFVTELGQFNLEINVAPRQLATAGSRSSSAKCAAASTTPRRRRARSVRE